MEKSHNSRQNSAKEILRNLSVQDFLNFGLQQVAYIKPVKVENREAYAIHAADGSVLSVLDSIDHAKVVVRHNELEPVTIH